MPESLYRIRPSRDLEIGYIVSKKQTPPPNQDDYGDEEDLTWIATRELAETLVRALEQQEGEALALLQEFVEAVDVTGGLDSDFTEVAAPMADPSWTDLGDLYLRACKFLGSEPIYSEE